MLDSYKKIEQNISKTLANLSTGLCELQFVRFIKFLVQIL